VNPSATQFAFENPAWLAATALVPLLWIYFQRSLVSLPVRARVASLVLRSVLLLLLILGLAEPRLRFASQRVALVALSDTSLSIGPEARKRAANFCQELREQAGSVLFREVLFPEKSEDDETDLAAAIIAARAWMPADRVPRMVLLTDGNANTGDTLGTAAAAGCEIDVVPLPSPEREVYMSAIEAPGEVRYGESFLLDVVIHSCHEEVGRVKLWSGAVQTEEREVKLLPGENRFQFRQTCDTRRIMRFSAQITGCRDTFPANNTAATIVLVKAQPRVLLIDPHPEQAAVWRDALQSEEQFTVEVITPEELPDRPGRLLDYDVLIVSNVPATALSEPQVAAIDRYVHDYAGGLVVVGGNRAFTAGDYGGTRLEAILPVETYVRSDKQKPSLAMVLVLDRSGSMQGAPIELARQAARQAIARLEPEDQVGILAFEDRVHWIVPLEPFTDAENVSNRIDTIVAGGGTNLYPAMDQAYLALRDVTADLRHMIVLSDGVSHPGDFDALAQRAAQDGITMSTVGVGNEASKAFLEKIADLASGHAYFCSDPAEVPRIFELDVMAAGKHGITEEPFQPIQVRPGRMFSGFDLTTVPPLLGYVDTRAKGGSQLLLASPAEDPILVWWRYGRGAAMAFTSDIHSRWAAAWHRWAGFGPFWARLVRQVMRHDLAPRFDPVIRRSGKRAEVILDAVDLQRRWLNSAEVVFRVERPDGRSEQGTCHLIEPGRYAAEISTERMGDYHLEFTIRVAGEPVHTIRRGFVVDYSEELRIQPPNVGLLRRIAEQTGGLFEPTVTEVLRQPDVRAPRPIQLWPWLFSTAVLLFVLDVALKRLGFQGEVSH